MWRAYIVSLHEAPGAQDGVLLRDDDIEALRGECMGVRRL